MSTNYTEEWGEVEAKEFKDLPFLKEVNHARTARAIFGCNCDNKTNHVSIDQIRIPRHIFGDNWPHPPTHYTTEEISKAKEILNSVRTVEQVDKTKE